ncbi:MAG: hypothetical protein LQ342_008484 [Letrouitia transgressa]|nr:MAG: hypothetical protein LQ342_008484 [Letrouitia transgressa]
MFFLTVTTVSIVALINLAASIDSQIPLAEDGTPRIPLLGFGTWNLNRSNASEAVSAAIQAGYRHIDGAAGYANQDVVGKGIADGLKKTGLNRSDIWVTSKLRNEHHSPAKVSEDLETTLSDFGLEHLDLYLMHWPVAKSNGKSYIEYLDTWYAMEKLLKAGKTRHIGVSNFSPAQLNDLIAHSDTKPAVHQFETHPYLQQREWLHWHQQHGIHVTAYSPLGNLNPAYDSLSPPLLVKTDAVQSIAEKRGCTPAQVILKWGISRGTSVIPKASKLNHIRENYRTIECEILDKDRAQINNLEKVYVKRFNNPSEMWGVPLYEGLEDS